MAILVRDLPAEERPREKLLQEGPAALSNTELLAVLLRTGTADRSALHVAEEVLACYRERGLCGVAFLSPEDLSKIRGVGRAKAASILAAVEFGRRLASARARVEAVHSPEDAARFAMPRLRFEQREHFAVMLLNRKNHILAMHDISIGSLSSSIVHPREVFRAAIRYAAAAMIVLHNHPSGDPTPSREDIAVTRRLVRAGELLDIPVLDHIIIGDNKFHSFKEKGMIS